MVMSAVAAESASVQGRSSLCTPRDGCLLPAPARRQVARRLPPLHAGRVLAGPLRVARFAYAWLRCGERLGGGDPSGTGGGVETGYCTDNQGCCETSRDGPGRDDRGPALHRCVHRRHRRAERYSSAAAEEGQKEGFAEELGADVFAGGAE